MLKNERQRNYLDPIESRKETDDSFEIVDRFNLNSLIISVLWCIILDAFDWNRTYHSYKARMNF